MLTATAGATGALVGFALGVLWLVAPLPEASAGASGAAAVSAAGRGTAAMALALVAAAAAMLDGFGVRPPSIRRQVPRAWARLLPLPVAACLYGARLGVGPLTVLNTWLWWAAAVLGAWAGPWWSTAAGGVFGVARIAVLVPMAAGVGAGRAMATRMARVQRRERMAQRVTAGAACALALVVALLLGACTGGNRDSDAGAGQNRDRSSAAAKTADGDDDGRNTGDGGDAGHGDAASRTLAASLPDDIGAGYERIPDGNRTGLGALDLDEAAVAEVDTSAERSGLETRRFRRGVARAWRSADDTAAISEVYVAVYEFADAKGAAAYLGDGLVTLEGRGASQYAVEGLDGATGFSQAERRADGALTTHGVVFARGARFFLVLTASPRPGSTPTEAAALARTLDARQAAAREEAAAPGR